MLELGKAGCDQSAECLGGVVRKEGEQKGMDLMLPSLLITEVHAPPESLCATPPRN